MDGLLIVDKPSGPTSHDVVARVRHALRERRIGHTGTLDPMASGVLPLLVGRATRLARFMSGEKTYEASIQLGLNTDTYDAEGHPEGQPYNGPWPERPAVDAALDAFRGTFLQQPPAFSAKKIAGKRSYALARRAHAAMRTAHEPHGPSPATLAVESEMPVAPVLLPDPVEVTAHDVMLLELSGPLVRLRVRCSAGFYIRSLAFDLGAALGTGAHLVALRRTSAAGFGLADAIPLDRIQAAGGADAAAAALIPMAGMLGEFPAVSLTAEGVSHVRFGRNLGPADATHGFAPALEAASGSESRVVRLLAPTGDLVAMAEAAPTPGLLHPAVVLL